MEDGALDLSNDDPEDEKAASENEPKRSPIRNHRSCCRDAVFDRPDRGPPPCADRGPPLCIANFSIIFAGGASDAKRQSPRTTGRWCTSTCIVLSAFCLLGCTEAKIHPVNAVLGASPSPDVPGPTAMAARKQNWGCPRIESAITSRIESMRSAKARAETEQGQVPPTLARMVARRTGPPGAGNAALTEFRKMRSDASQLNDLLKEKGCARYKIDVEAPTFLHPQTMPSEQEDKRDEVHK